MSIIDAITSFWQQLQFLQAGWLWLIPACLIFFLLYRLRPDYSQKMESASLSSTRDKTAFFHPLATLLSRQDKKTQTAYKSIIYSICFILLTLAMAQPAKTGKKLPPPPPLREITFIIDASVSMILRDYILDGKRIDRMSLLKTVLNNFISQLPGQKMSIIVFGDHAYTLVPLTSDTQLLTAMINRVEATMAGRFNAMGEAISLAVSQSTKAEKKNAHRRILVLLTDADQPTGSISPLSASKLAGRQKMPIYTVAVGASSDKAAERKLAGLLYSPVNLTLLQAITENSGGKLYRATDYHSLQQAIQQINSSTTYQQKSKPVFYRQPLHQWLLISAILLFSLYQLICLFKSDVMEKTHA